MEGLDAWSCVEIFVLGVVLIRYGIHNLSLNVIKTVVPGLTETVLTFFPDAGNFLFLFFFYSFII